MEFNWIFAAVIIRIETFPQSTSVLIMDNIYSAAAPFLRLLEFFGLFPMTFRGPATKGIIAFRWTDLIATFCLFLLISLTIVSSNVNKSFVTSNSNLLVHGWQISNYLLYLSMLLISAYQVLKRKNIVAFLRKLHEADGKVKAFIEF
jgi:hypothetical protein